MAVSFMKEKMSVPLNSHWACNRGGVGKNGHRARGRRTECVGGERDG